MYLLSLIQSPSSNGLVTTAERTYETQITNKHTSIIGL